MTVTPYAAVVLAGGAGHRIGGPDKPTLAVHGQPMLHRVLAAVGDATPRIVVGPPGLPLPPDAVRTQEHPPGGGPAAGTAAGLALVPPEAEYVALLAADLPLLTTGAVRDLRRATDTRGVAGAVFVDGDDQPQWLCGVWRAGALRSRLAALPRGPAGVPVRRLLGELPAARVVASGEGPPPWWDCDTADDLRRAEELADRPPGDTA